MLAQRRLVAALVLRTDERGLPVAVLMRRSPAVGVVFDLPGGALDAGEFPQRGVRRHLAAGEPVNLLMIPRLAWQCSELLTLIDPPAFGFVLTARLHDGADGLASRPGRPRGLLWVELLDIQNWLSLGPPGLMSVLLPAIAGRRGGDWRGRDMRTGAIWPAETLVASETNPPTGGPPWQTAAA